MSGSVNPLHCVIDATDERTWHARQRLAPGDRREIMETLCSAREAALHFDHHAVLQLCEWIERRVRDLRMIKVARWLSDGNAERHPRVVAWFESMKTIEERRRNA